MGSGSRKRVRGEEFGPDSIEQAMRERIRETIEARRKVTDTERRLLEAQQHAIDAVQLRSLVTFFLASLREHVLPLEGGRDAILGVSRDIRKIMSGADPETTDLDPSKAIEA